MASEAKFGEQSLRRGDLVGFIVNVDMGEHKGGVGGKCAEHLCGGAVIEAVETATQRLAVEGNAALPRGRATGALELVCVAAEDVLDRAWIERSKDVADGGMGRRTAAAQCEGPIEAPAINVDEGDDATIRVAAGHDGQDRKQQYVG